MDTWVPTPQATELCRGCPFLWFATLLLFERALGREKRGGVFWKCRGVALPSAAVDSNAHGQDQCQHHESSHNDQPVCRDRWGRARERVSVSHGALPCHTTAETQSLLLLISCHTLFLASVNVCLVYTVFQCKSNTFSSLSYTQASSDEIPHHCCHLQGLWWA